MTTYSKKKDINNIKFISYKITVGGDAGWRFSNRSEWCSNEGYLLFDKNKWTMNSIAKEMKHLWRQYWSGDTGSTYEQTYNAGIVYVKNLIKEDGVYAWYRHNPYEITFVDWKEKLINPPVENIETWNIDGNIVNYDYRL